MAKHCTNCGHGLRETDKFCAECGSTVGGAAPQTTPTRWEYCELGFQEASHLLSRSGGFFVMQISGPHGLRTEKCSIEIGSDNYQSGFSVTLGPNRKVGPAVLNQVVQNIIAAGWELLPDRGSAWWNYKFRRQVPTGTPRAIFRPPPPKDFHDMLAQMAGWANEHRYEEALAVIESYLSVHPDDEMAWLFKGQTLRDAGRVSEAEAAYKHRDKLISRELALIDEKLASDPGNKKLWETKISKLEALKGKEAANEARRQWQAIRKGG